MPTSPSAGTHRPNHRPNICDACKRIDTRVIEASERYTLLTNFWDLEESSTYCRFCAMLFQTLRGRDNQDIDTTLAALGLTRKDPCSLCLSLDAGILRVYVAPFPRTTADYAFTLAKFNVYLDEGAGSVAEILGEATVDNYQGSRGNCHGTSR